MIRGDSIGLDTQVRASLARHKMLTARLLEPHGFTTPESVSFDLDSLRHGLEFLTRVGGPLVLKPDGTPSGGFLSGAGPGAGRGITCGVRTPAELTRAARWAAMFGAKVIAEKQIDGASYRLLYLDGEMIDAVRRDSPRVFGDGMSTIDELLHYENGERRGARPPVALHPVVADLDCHLTLARQDLNLRSVLKAQEVVTVKTACNQNAAYDNHIVRDAIHPDLARLGGKLVRELGLRLAGVDVIAQDVSRPPAERSFVFNEINANPGLHHHCLVANPQHRAPVGERVLQAALS